MKATAFEFRIRFFIHILLIVLGFTAPWDRWLHLDSLGPNPHVWGVLAAHLFKLSPRALTVGGAFNLLLAVAAVCAIAAAALRTWASAYMGPATVHSTAMQGDGVVAAGPYRHLRNPLYVGIVIHVVALALLMPPSGAIFCIVTVALFQLRLIGGEEAFLTQKLGQPYLAYCARVPSIFPALAPRVPASTARPAWAMAFLSEIYLWGVAITYVGFGHRYNASVLEQGILISLGVMLIVQALLPRREA